MRTVPRNKLPQLIFFETHLPTWEDNAAALGLDPDRLAALAARVAAARAACLAQEAALERARAETLAVRLAMRAMRRDGAVLIEQIRLRAATLGNRAYVLGQVPAPADGGPLPPPGEPYAFTSDLKPSGALLLGWKCDNPPGARGTTYHLSRRTDTGAGLGDYTFIGIAGRKRFTDATLPPGVRQVTYRVQAIRSTSAGPAAVHQHRFGTTDPVDRRDAGVLQLAA